MDSPSSASVITGRLIFLTITALPESDAATSLGLNCLFSKTRLIASATAAPSMIPPSTMLSGGTGSMPNATTFHALPADFSSTALTALDPMSRPTTAFDLPRPNTTVCPFRQAQPWKRGTTAGLPADCQKPPQTTKFRPGCVRELAELITVPSACYKKRRPDRTTSPLSFIGTCVPLLHTGGGARSRLDTPQKRAYDLGLPLPGPARL